MFFEGAPVFIEGDACAWYNGTMASPSLHHHLQQTRSHKVDESQREITSDA